MKFKASLFASLFAAPLLATTVTSANTFGIVKVDSDRTATVVAVPWVACGTTTTPNAPIKVVDLVTTTNLTVGDVLYYWDDGNIKSFTYNGTSWVAANSANTTEEYNVGSLGDTDATVGRNVSLMLVRQSTSNPFYVYGQVSTDETPTKTIATGMNLVSSPLAKDLVLNGVSAGWSFSGAPANGDQVMIPLAGGTFKTYTYNASSSQWIHRYWDGSAMQNDTNLTVPAGEGFWYKHKGSGLTITWL